MLVNKLVSPEEDVADAEVALGVWKLNPADELDVVVENKPVDGVVLDFVVDVPNKPDELVAAGASVDPKSPPLAFLVDDPNKPPVDGAEAAVVLAAGAPNKLLVVDDDVVCGFAGAPNKPPLLWFEGVDNDPNKPALFVFFEAPKRPPPLDAVVLAGVPKLNKKDHCQLFLKYNYTSFTSYIS